MYNLHNTSLNRCFCVVHLWAINLVLVQMMDWTQIVLCCSSHTSVTLHLVSNSTPLALVVVDNVSMRRCDISNLMPRILITKTLVFILEKWPITCIWCYKCSLNIEIYVIMLCLFLCVFYREKCPWVDYKSINHCSWSACVSCLQLASLLKHCNYH